MDNKQQETAKDVKFSGLDLMDWKELERASIDAIRNGEKSIAVNRIMLDSALYAIDHLGGKSAEQEEKEAKAQSDKLKKNSTE